jgi:hypothetical protein
VIEGAFGGFVEFSGARFGVGGRWIWIYFRFCFGRIRRYFEHFLEPFNEADTFIATKQMGGSYAQVSRPVVLSSPGAPEGALRTATIKLRRENA